MKIKARNTRIPYNEEEKVRMFQEGMIRVPSKHENKKKYNRKRLEKIHY